MTGLCGTAGWHPITGSLTTYWHPITVSLTTDWHPIGSQKQHNYGIAFTSSELTDAIAQSDSLRGDFLN